MNNSIVRNSLGVIAVSAAALALWIASPDPSAKEAHLLCGGHEIAAIYPDMGTCTTDPRFKAGECGCARPQSTWYVWYSALLVPGIATVLAFIVLRGSLALRLSLLNGAIALALVLELFYALIHDPESAMVVPVYPIIILVFCVGATVFFSGLDLLGRWWRRRNGRVAG
jgi:hypothetical protein